MPVFCRVASLFPAPWQANIAVVYEGNNIDTLKDALQQSERKLTAAARLARLGYWEDDVVADRLSWSEETCHVLGLPLGERARPWDTFRELVHPDDLRIVEEARARMRRGEPS